jgi:hypothetical protein
VFDFQNRPFDVRQVKVDHRRRHEVVRIENVLDGVHGVRLPLLRYVHLARHAVVDRLELRLDRAKVHRHRHINHLCVHCDFPCRVVSLGNTNRHRLDHGRFLAVELDASFERIAHRRARLVRRRGARKSRRRQIFTNTGQRPRLRLSSAFSDQRTGERIVGYVLHTFDGTIACRGAGVNRHATRTPELDGGFSHSVRRGDP